MRRVLILLAVLGMLALRLGAVAVFGCRPVRGRNPRRRSLFA
jgi:hypothetical protein